MKLNKIFTSNMVFAANKPIRIYGYGVGEAVIRFGDTEKKVASESDEWYTELPAMQYGGPYTLAFESEGSTTVLEDVYVGEVYLFAGQSNMQFKLGESSSDPKKCRAKPEIRMLNTDKIEKGERFALKDGWIKCDDGNIADWSAIAYHTAITLSDRKDIAVGAICCYQGASVIESWVRSGLFAENGIVLTDEEKFIDHFEYHDWNGDGVIYSYALSQVIPFALSGVVWYQGESDASLAESRIYKKELSLLIDHWRSEFKNESLPFVVVQIADFIGREREAWSNIQKAQADIQNEKKKVISVRSADVCEKDNIHPPTKDKLSIRIVDALYELV